jgi:hypothetical protein
MVGGAGGEGGYIYEVPPAEWGLKININAYEIDGRKKGGCQSQGTLRRITKRRFSEMILILEVYKSGGLV